MTAKLADDFRPVMGKRIAERMKSYNAACAPDAPLSEFVRQNEYLAGVEMVLVWAEIAHKFNMDADGKRYLSVTLEGETFAVPDEGAAP